MIREDVLSEFYELPRLSEEELAAIEVALPYWVAVNVFLNRPKEADVKLKNEWPLAWTADYQLEVRGITWKYRRGPVKFCHVEYELRRQAAEIIFDVDNPRRVDLRAWVVTLLSELNISPDNTPDWWKQQEGV